jgi:hypothetical protein
MQRSQMQRANEKSGKSLAVGPSLRSWCGRHQRFPISRTPPPSAILWTGSSCCCWACICTFQEATNLKNRGTGGRAAKEKCNSLSGQRGSDGCKETPRQVDDHLSGGFNRKKPSHLTSLCSTPPRVLWTSFSCSTYFLLHPPRISLISVIIFVRLPPHCSTPFRSGNQKYST